LALPPVLGCILVYPRLHYIVMVAFAAALLVARLARSLEPPPYAAAFAAALALILVLTLQPMPRVAQPRVAIVAELETLPPIHDMVEDDGGWCYYLTSRCRPFFLDGITGAADEARLTSLMLSGAIDGVMVSPALRRYEAAHPNAAVDALLAGA